MSRGYSTSKKDSNHDAIVDEMYARGIHWHDTHDQGDRALDGIAYNPHTMVFRFVEIKSSMAARFTQGERQFMEDHLGQCYIVRDSEDVAELRGIL